MGRQNAVFICNRHHAISSFFDCTLCTGTSSPTMNSSFRHTRNTTTTSTVKNNLRSQCIWLMVPLAYIVHPIARMTTAEPKTHNTSLEQKSFWLGFILQISDHKTIGSNHYIRTVQDCNKSWSWLHFLKGTSPDIYIQHSINPTSKHSGVQRVVLLTSSTKILALDPSHPPKFYYLFLMPIYT